MIDTLIVLSVLLIASVCKALAVFGRFNARRPLFANLLSLLHQEETGHKASCIVLHQSIISNQYTIHN
jgi:hypothetical protein